MQRMGMVIGPGAGEGRRSQASAFSRSAGSGADLPLQQWQVLHLIQRAERIRKQAHAMAAWMPCQNPLETRKEGEWWTTMDKTPSRPSFAKT